MNSYQVEINKEEKYVAIQRNGKTEFCWPEHLWISDPELVFCISNLLVMALTRPEEMDQYIQRLDNLL